jgi:hypothetical protein
VQASATSRFTASGTESGSGDVEDVGGAAVEAVASAAVVGAAVEEPGSGLVGVEGEAGEGFGGVEEGDSEVDVEQVSGPLVSSVAFSDRLFNHSVASVAVSL